MKQFEVSLDLLVEAPNDEEAWHLAEYISANVANMWQAIDFGVQSRVMECVITGCEDAEALD